MLVTSSLSMISNFRSGFFDFGSFASRSLCRRSRSRCRLSRRLFSSSRSTGLSANEDSEFLRAGRLLSDFRGEALSLGSAKISSSSVGRDLVVEDPVPALRARIASSCDLEGRWPDGPLGGRGGTFSPRVAAVYDGGGRELDAFGAGLSSKVRLSCRTMVSNGGSNTLQFRETAILGDALRIWTCLWGLQGLCLMMFNDSQKRRTNSSAALPINAGLGGAIESFANDILSGDATGCEYKLGAASRKGFRETGRGGGSKGER